MSGLGPISKHQALCHGLFPLTPAIDKDKDEVLRGDVNGFN